MVTEVRLGESLVQGHVGEKACLRLRNSENIFTIHNDRTCRGYAAWLSDRVKQLGNRLNSNTVIVISDNRDLEESVRFSCDLYLHLSKANENPAWALTVLEKMIKQADTEKGVCYLLLDTTYWGHAHDNLAFVRLLESNILEPYADKLVVNRVGVYDDLIDKAKCYRDTIEVVSSINFTFDTMKIADFTNPVVLNTIARRMNEPDDMVIVLQKGHAIKVKPATVIYAKFMQENYNG